MKKENAELFVEVFDCLRESNREMNDLADEHKQILRFDKFFSINDGYMAAIFDLSSSLFDISLDWIDWFVNENHYGDRCHTCSNNDVEYVIDSPQAFVNFLLLPDSE